jgi:Na+/phosphate symporter
LVKESYKRLNNHVKISPQTEQKLSEIYKELFQTAQITLEALLENDHAKAQQVIESKLRFYGLIERTRSHLYVRLKTEQPEHLLVYKIEISAMENFKRIYNQLRNICKLIAAESSNTENNTEEDQDTKN